MDLELLAFASGMVGGICSSAPLGIINLWITDAVLSKNEHKIIWFIAGVVLADAIHASMASWGYHEFLQKSGFERWIGILGGAFVVIMGLMSLRKSETALKPHPPPSISRKAHEFTIGLMMCGLNPGFLVFWMFVIDQIESKTGLHINGFYLLIFLLGLIVGDGLWFGAIVGLARKGRDHVNPRKLQLIRTSIAYLFIVVGIYAIYKSIKEPAHHQGITLIWNSIGQMGTFVHAWHRNIFSVF